MKAILFIIMGLIIAKGETTVFDFNSPGNSGQWYPINDMVMGGLSQSNMLLNSDGTATFSGNVSLKNNGGFASVRAIINPLPKKEFKGVMLRVKGDGNVFNLRFRTNQNFDGYAYEAKVKTEKDVWKEFKILFADFTPIYRGKALKDKPVLVSNKIAQIGILIADKQVGTFELRLDWIKFFE